MTSETLPPLLSSALKGAPINLEACGFIVPTALVLARRDPRTKERRRFVIPIACMDFDEHGKDIWDTMLRALVIEAEAEAICLIHEAYMVEIKKDTGDDAEKLMKEGIADHPSRREVIMVRFEDDTGSCRSFIARMHRDQDGPHLAEFEESMVASETIVRFGGFFRARVKA